MSLEVLQLHYSLTEIDRISSNGFLQPGLQQCAMTLPAKHLEHRNGSLLSGSSESCVRIRPVSIYLFTRFCQCIFWTTENCILRGKLIPPMILCWRSPVFNFGLRQRLEISFVYTTHCPWLQRIDVVEECTTLMQGIGWQNKRLFVISL